MRTPNDPRAEFPINGLESYYQDFRETRIQELLLMEKALIGGDFQLIKELAHKWRGFAAPYGFGLLGQIAIDLEMQADALEFDFCQGLLLEADEYLRVQKIKDDPK